MMQQNRDTSKTSKWGDDAKRVPAFGIVNPWPGDMSAESEVMARMKKASLDIGVDCIMLSNFGHVLDEDQKCTDTFVDPSQVDLVITTHYDSPKTVDAFYYHTLWNPPEIPLNLIDYPGRVTDNYLMNDDYLIYDFGGMSNHLRGILINRPRTLEGASCLVASFPESAMLKPNLNNPKLFYCGMNWERIVHKTNRHEGLFKMLDETGCVRFYGPDKNPAWGGIAPWEGYKSYQYPIPFDGFSILKEINKCGIVLVLSSDIHRRAGAATNRTYEACAGGAVIISDDNPFMEHYFKDAALFINYNKNNPKDTFDQIMEKYQWIKENPEKALELARKSQKIFREKFSLDKQLTDLLNNHTKRFTTIAGDLFARDEDEEVLVTFVVSPGDPEIARKHLEIVLKNISNQLYKNITLAVACDYNVESELKNFCQKLSVHVNIVPMALYDNKNSRYMTDGQAIIRLQGMFKHGFYINTFTNELWFKDHITTLVRGLQDNPEAYCAYSGRLHEDIEGYRRTDCFKNLDIGAVYNAIGLPCAGQAMYRYEAEALLPDFIFDFIDGLEHYAYILLLKLKYKKELVFTKRMTLVYTNQQPEKEYICLNPHYQTRLLQDLVKFDLPESGLTRNVQISAETLSSFPIKLWLKMKYYRFRVFHAKLGSKSFEGYSGKYADTMRHLEEVWRTICI